MKKLLVATTMVALAASQALAADEIRACGKSEQGVDSVVSVMFDGDRPFTRLTKSRFEQVGDVYLLTYKDGGKTNLLAVSAASLLSHDQARALADDLGLQVRDLTWDSCQ